MNRKLLFFVGLILIFFSLSCSKKLEEKAFTFVSAQDLIDGKSYQELVSGAYVVLSWPFMYGSFHEVVNFDNDYQTGPVWAFGTMGAGNFYEYSSVNAFYQYLYTAIHRAQYHRSLIAQMDIPGEEKNNAIGELKFLEAFCYFNLVQFYGELPLFKKSISEGEELYKPRSSIKDVYEYIIDLLTDAGQIMYSRFDAGYQIGHPSSGSAKSLLVRVYCTIGSASMPSGTQISVRGGKPYYLNDDGDMVRYPSPHTLTFSKSQVSGYGDFDSEEYYKLAMQAAKDVIESGEFGLYESQERLWNPSSKNGKEFIFTLQTLAGNEDLSNFVATDYAGYYQANGSLSSGYYVQRDHWFQLFDKGDERIEWGVIHRVPFSYDETNDRLLWSYYPARDSVKVKRGIDGYETTDILRYDAHLYGSKLMKFRQVTAPLNGNRTDFNFPFMRYAEILLLYAEADNEVNNGPSDYAIRQVEKLNVRNNSELVSEMGPWDQVSFRSYILEERAKEFAAEGLRRFDLLRWGIYLKTMNAIGDADENGVIKRRQERHLLLPLPQDEVNTNPYIETNNPGW